MSAQAYLRCLGQPILTSAAGQTIRFRTKKHLALLTYLAVEGERQHRRDRLAELLWPKAGVAEGRHSLATALSILRARLGPESIVATREHVTFATYGVATDLDRLIRGEVVGDAEQPLEVAGFLEGFDIPDAMEFGLWKDRQQARLLPFITKALRELMDHCRRTGDTRRIELLADRMLALDELSEEAIRAKMEARALAGDRLTALRIYDAWEQKLAAELKAAPSAVIEGMAIRLRRRGWERTALTNIPTVPTDQWKGRSFCGRAKEYRFLYEAWEQTKAGHSVHPLVLGDSGIGKTTLVERFTTSAGLEGAAVTRVQCYGLDQDVPYATLCSLVRGLLDQPGVLGAPPESLAELSRLVPEIRRRFPGLPTTSSSIGEAARIRYAECLHDLLAAVADEHAVILVFDDLHLSDETSLAVLQVVIRRGQGQAIMVVMTARPHELGLSQQACRLRDAAGGLGIRETECPPLTAQESHEVLESLCMERSSALPPAVRRSLVTAAAGYPMVLDLLHQDWCAHGSQSLVLALRSMTTELSGASAPPQLYRQVLERLLRSMDATTQAVLNVASILGPRLNDLVHYRMADLTIGQAMAGLADLVSRRVLRDGGKGLEFVNELLRTAAYLGVPSPLRRALHSAIADQLMKAEDPPSGSFGLEIAWHCMRAARQAEARQYLMSGARHAIRAGAADSTEKALTTALPALSGSERVDASLLLAEVLQEQGRFDEAIDLLSSLRTDVSGARRERAIALEALAARYVAPVGDSMRAMVPPLRDVVREATDVATRALAARALAYLLFELRDEKLMVELLEMLDHFPREGLDMDSADQLALARTLLLYQVGRRAAGLALASEALCESRRCGVANLATLQLQSGVGSILSSQGRYREAVAAFQDALEMAHRLGNDRHSASISGNIALCIGRLGRYPEQLDWASKGLSHKRHITGMVVVQLAYCQAFALAMTGKAKEAITVIGEMDVRLPSLTPDWQVKAWSLWKADILLLVGKRAEALEAAQIAVADQTFGLETPAFGGPFARWTYFTRGAARNDVEARLGEMIRNLTRYDVLDQAEVLCAYRLQTGRGFPGELWVQLQTILGALPESVTAQLEALGLLVKNEGALCHDGGAGSIQSALEANRF